MLDEFFDLYDFARLVKEKSSNGALQTTAQDIMNAIQDDPDAGKHYIIYNQFWSGIIPANSGSVSGNTWILDHSHGVSIFFPKPDNKRSFYNGLTLTFASGTDWMIGTQSISSGDASTQAIVNQWGPMLVAYVNLSSPGAIDDPTLPPVESPLIGQAVRIYLPAVRGK